MFRFLCMVAGMPMYGYLSVEYINVKFSQISDREANSSVGIMWHNIVRRDLLVTSLLPSQSQPYYTSDTGSTEVHVLQVTYIQPHAL